MNSSKVWCCVVLYVFVFVSNYDNGEDFFACFLGGESLWNR